ncbi:HK97 family phage prohead protease [Maricaulis sp. CAU 1757]
MRVAGHASVFGVVDLVGDVVMAGAFARSLRGGRPVPMLFQHEPGERVGVWDVVREDGRGLWVEGEISGDGARARTARRLVGAGKVDGLSIGFRTRRAEAKRRGGRDIHEVDLWEVSIVSFPMLPQARLQRVRRPALAA